MAYALWGRVYLFPNGGNITVMVTMDLFEDCSNFNILQFV